MQRKKPTLKLKKIFLDLFQNKLFFLSSGRCIVYNDSVKKASKNSWFSDDFM